VYSCFGIFSIFFLQKVTLIVRHPWKTIYRGNLKIKAEATFSAAQTKGNKARKVWFAEKIRVELAAYVAAHRTYKLSRTRRRSACASGIGRTQQYGDYTKRYIDLRPAMLKAAVELV
jgi:hypothetical protein